MNAVDLMAAMALEDGRLWGDVAAEFQLGDARAIFSADGPRWHFLTRPRGGSKTTDCAAAAIAWLAVEARPGDRGYVVATDRDQGALLVDAADGLVRRTPAIAGTISVSAMKLTASSGATLEVLAADGDSAFGLVPSLVVVDEAAQWASTRNAKRVWSAVVSSMQKVPGSRLVVLTSAGEPRHWTHKVLEEAKRSPDRWHVSEVPGPLPWVDPAELEAQRPLLADSEFERLHLNRWTASEDRLANPDDLAACVVLDGPLAYQPGRRYTIAVDLGLKDDRTVAAVCHAEPQRAGETVTGHHVVLDRMQVWSGTRRKPVDIGEVEAWLAQAVDSYGRARIVLDPWQAMGMAQRLRARGIEVAEFTFSAQSVGRLGSALMLAIRNHTLHLPDDEALLDELANVRLRETSPGVLRLDHDAGQHDDRAVCLAMAVVDLLDRPTHAPEIMFADDTAVAPDGRPLQQLVGPYAMSPGDTFAAHLEQFGD